MIVRSLIPFCVLALLGVSIRADDLPPDAKKLIEENEKASQEILDRAQALLRKAQQESEKAQEEVRERKAKLIAQLEELANRLEKEGKAAQSKIVAEQAIELKTGRVAGAEADPGTLVGLRGQDNKTFIFDVTGRVGGSVWGTDIYTDDSTLAAAAVHAGVLKDGERGAVKVTILAGEQGYTSSTRNGVTTGNWGAWNGSFKVEPYRRGQRVPVKVGDGVAPAQRDPGTLQGFRGQNGKSFVFEVTGNANGAIWGTDTYTDDSALATVAVHAGLLKVGEKGLIKVTIQPGEASYTDSTRNGVTSNSYAQWEGSYRVEKVQPKK